LFILAISLSPAALPVLATPAAAQPAKTGPGTAAVKQANDTITGLLKKKAPAAEVAKAIRSFLDIDELGKVAMKDQWAKLKAPEQAEFLKVLRELIEANYVKVQQSNLEYTVNYTGESADASNNIVVKTEIQTQRKGRPFKISIDYVLSKQGGTLKAFDVITDGVSLVDNYRQMFNKVIKDKGFAGLMSTMKAKITQIQSAPNGAAAAGSAAPTKT
jgi:phospholipid transport system substrate-binding protein